MTNTESTIGRIREEKIIAIVRGVRADIVTMIAEALYAGGIRLLEITCNTPGVIEIIKEITRTMNGRMLIGAGTVISKDLAEKAICAGAKFALAPDVNPEVIKCCLANDIAIIPGAMTPTEILYARRLGSQMIKVFPAGALGTAYIEQIRGPIDDVDLIAVGGIDGDNISSFINAGCIGVGLGSSLIRKDLVEAQDWKGLTALAAEMKSKTG